MNPLARYAATILVGAAILCGSPDTGWATEDTRPLICPICRQVNDEKASYASRAGNTLLRGTANALLGWTELIRQPAKEVEEGRTPRNVLTGIAKGIRQSVRRTASGVTEVFTFWMPKTEGKQAYTTSDCPLCMGRATQKPPSR